MLVELNKTEEEHIRNIEAHFCNRCCSGRAVLHIVSVCL